VALSVPLAVSISGTTEPSVFKPKPVALSILPDTKSFISLAKDMPWAFAVSCALATPLIKASLASGCNPFSVNKGDEDVKTYTSTLFGLEDVIPFGVAEIPSPDCNVIDLPFLSVTITPLVVSATAI